MYTIFNRNDDFKIQTGSRKKFKPNEGWYKFLRQRKGNQFSGRTNDNRQHVYLNVRYYKVNNWVGKALAKAHLDYISRHGVGKDKQDPELYGNINKEQLINIHANEENQFRFIISPESLGNVKLKEFITSYMKYLRRRTGLELQWVAADHYNTPHPHTHIIIKGVDMSGKAIRFDRHQIRTVFRDIARDFLTYLNGTRIPNQEINIQRARTTHYCYLDKRIEAVIGNNNLIEHKFIDIAFTENEKRLIKERLTFLASINLVTYAPRGYEFAFGWSTTLKQIGLSDEFLGAIQSIKFNLPSQTIKFNKEVHKSACGIIAIILKKIMVFFSQSKLDRPYYYPQKIIIGGRIRNKPGFT